MDDAQLPLAPAAPQIDPWAVTRAALPSNGPAPILLRVILVNAGTQGFVQIPRTRDNAAAEVYDGATMIRPEGPYSTQERAEIIRWANELWQAEHARAAA